MNNDITNALRLLESLENNEELSNDNSENEEVDFIESTNAEINKDKIKEIDLYDSLGKHGVYYTVGAEYAKAKLLDTTDNDQLEQLVNEYHHKIPDYVPSELVEGFTDFIEYVKEEFI